MRPLQEVDSAYFAELLGETCPGCTAENAENRINPDPGKRVVFVGLGGSGLKTLDEIKRWVTKNMMAHWTRCIGFLAVDCDRWEYERSKYLKDWEFVPAAAPGLGAMTHTPAVWPGAWQFIADENQIRGILLADDCSTQRSRVKAKLMFRFPRQDGMAADVDFRWKLHRILQERMDLPLTDGRIEVYVIAGLGGGFGSGLAPEMAALIRRVLGDAEVHGILYTPDVFAPLDPAGRQKMEANGFAALKELNYIQELKHRPGELLAVPVSDPAEGFCLRIPGTGAEYDTITLMGTGNSARPWTREEAVATAAEQMISVLLDPVPHPRNGMAPPVPLAPVQAYPASMDFAAADAVKTGSSRDLMWAWYAARLCEKAGFYPVTLQERADRIAAGETFLPFLGEKQFLPAQEMNRCVHELLAPLRDVMGQYQKRDFRYAQVIPGGAPTWEAIREGRADDIRVQGFTGNFEKQILSSAMQTLTGAVRHAFCEFQNMAKLYVEQNGPMAFVNLYLGNSVCEAKGMHPVGIRQVVCMIHEDRNPMTGNPMVWPREADCWNQSRQLLREIMAEQDNNIFRALYRRRREGQAEAWTNTYDETVNARINQQRRKMMLGRNGILEREFLKPAECLMRQIQGLGKVLMTVTEINRRQAEPLSDLVSFSHWAENQRDGAAWAIHAEACQSLLVRLRQGVAQTDPVSLRREILEAFWNHPEQWTEYDEQTVRGCDPPRLTDPRNPVPARIFFDKVLLELVGMPDAPLSALFQDLIVRGISADSIIHMLLQDLRRRMKNLPGGTNRACRLLYPQNLDSAVGPGTTHLLQNMAHQVFGNVNCLPTEDLTALRLVAMELGLEARQTVDLRCWRESYRCCLHDAGNGLHGYGPRQDPENPDPGFWEDAPDLPEEPAPMV